MTSFRCFQSHKRNNSVHSALGKLIFVARIRLCHACKTFLLATSSGAKISFRKAMNFLAVGCLFDLIFNVSVSVLLEQACGERCEYKLSMACPDSGPKCVVLQAAQSCRAQLSLITRTSTLGSICASINHARLSEFAKPEIEYKMISC